MKDVFFVHELDSADDLCVVKQEKVIEGFILGQFHEQIFERSLFAEFHDHEETGTVDFVIDVLDDVGVVENFKYVDFLVVGGIADGLLDGDRFEAQSFVVAETVLTDNPVSFVDFAKGAASEGFAAVDNVVTVPVVSWLFFHATKFRIALIKF
jgi:hypothetical protein